MKKADWAVLLPTQADLAIGISEKEEEQTLLSLYGRSRRSVIGSHIRIGKKAGEAFWDLYQEFQDKKRKILTANKSPLAGEPAAIENPVKNSKPKKEKKIQSAMAALYARFSKKFGKLIGRSGASKLLLVELQLDSSLAVYAYHKERAGS
ncbi:hypothetical protein [Mucilaginibacter sp. SJ]|uniref:hypothetical protein n=1 Tax=Mucilaginibacter sp. SJ TaxID=3029053 RepID=UPI0023A9DFCF|nr:hypothetical protein [Mucilaginibacter sp. SJ]WEA01799.1 hypothetical protein MusilaSJ_02535 [Mucilaginibacter sp. SJ]